MPPGPPKSGSGAASDGKAALSRSVADARFADAPPTIEDTCQNAFQMV